MAKIERSLSSSRSGRLALAAAAWALALPSVMWRSSASLTPGCSLGWLRMYFHARMPANTVPTPATTKANRHEPSQAISPEIRIAPRALPSGAPPSTSTAPRPRSLGVSQAPLSLAPAGMIGDSATPRPMRVSSSTSQLCEAAPSAWNRPQATVAAPMMPRVWKRSSSMPPGICIKA
ncbi:hypothetical protein D3C75_652060 [compost metagenome]